MRHQLNATTVVLLCTSLILDGCASRRHAFPDMPAIQYWTTSNPSMTGGNSPPPERLATAPRLVADERPIDVSAFEISEEERARLQTQRSAYIRGKSPTSADVGEAVLHCLVRGVIVLCPFIAAAAAPFYLTYKAGSMAMRAAKDDTYIPEKGSGGRLGAVFSEHSSSIILRDEVSRRLLSPPAGQVEFPRLIVGIESAGLMPVAGGVALVITARSQAITGPGAKGVETTHKFTSPRRNVDEWLASNGKLFRDDLDVAFETLSSNIASLYKPERQ